LNKARYAQVKEQPDLSAEIMSIILRLIRFHIIINIIPENDYRTRILGSAQALPNHLENNPNPAIQGGEVGFKENRRDWILGERSSHCSGESDRTRVVGEEGC